MPLNALICSKHLDNCSKIMHKSSLIISPYNIHAGRREDLLGYNDLKVDCVPGTTGFYTLYLI